jgi:predicted DNA-binding transcriptional regulator YafY
MSDHVERIVRIMSILGAGNHFTIYELRDRLAAYSDDYKEVSIRQLQRDIANIRSSGVPIIDKKDGNQTRYSLERSARVIIPPKSARHELLAKYLIKATLPILRESGAIDSAQELSTSLEEEAPGEILPSTDMLESISLGHFTGSIDDGVLTRIINAVAQQSWVRIEYKNKAVKYESFPCKIVPYMGRLYLVAWNDHFKDYSVYAIDEVTNIRTIREQRKPHTFSLTSFMRNRFGLWEAEDKRSKLIRVRIQDERIASLFRKKYWHPTQAFTSDNTGALIIEMQAGVSPELVSWVLHWAPNIEVLQPNELKEMVAERAKKLLDQMNAQTNS